MSKEWADPDLDDECCHHGISFDDPCEDCDEEEEEEGDTSCYHGVSYDDPCYACGRTFH